MKRTFFKTSFILALGISVVALSSCKKDDEDSGFKIVATNVTGSSSQVKTVKALVDWEINDDDGTEAIAESAYKNNGFTLVLPATLPAKYLLPISEGLPEGITVSDGNAKISLALEINGFQNANEIGSFQLLAVKGVNALYLTSWIFSEKNLAIQGREQMDDEFFGEFYSEIDLNLKKGWNEVYLMLTSEGDDVIGSISSKKPSGVNFTWTFFDNHDSYLSSKVSVPTERARSLFSIFKDKGKEFERE